jgi:N-acetylmuramoyl-L-alanine amidase
MRKYLSIFLIPLFLTACVQHSRHQEIDVVAFKPKPAVRPSFKTPPKGKAAPTPLKAPLKIPEKEPLVSSSKKAPTQKPVEKKSIVVIDAGHGGKDTGALSAKHKYEEKTLTLMTARLVKDYLEEMDYKVILTRTKDASVSLEKRAELANSLDAALFVSIHYNFASNETAHGIEIFYYKDDKNPASSRLLQSKRLGEEVLATIVKHTGASPRGIKKANFAVIRETKMPAILIEGGFLSNPSERERLKEGAYQKFLAWGIARGIDGYLVKRKA